MVIVVALIRMLSFVARKCINQTKKETISIHLMPEKTEATHLILIWKERKSATRRFEQRKEKLSKR